MNKKPAIMIHAGLYPLRWFAFLNTKYNVGNINVKTMIKATNSEIIYDVVETAIPNTTAMELPHHQKLKNSGHWVIRVIIPATKLVLGFAAMTEVPGCFKVF